MTAEVIHFPNGGARVDATIRATVKALMEGRGWSKEDLARRADVSDATLYRRLATKNPTSFKAAEVALIADALGVSVAQLYDGLGGIFGPPDDGCAARESNPQPADLVFPLVKPANVVHLDEYRRKRNAGEGQEEAAA